MKKEVKNKILAQIGWLMVKNSNAEFFELEKNIIIKYEKQNFDFKEPKSEGLGYCIFSIDGKKTNNITYGSFNECLLVIALNLSSMDNNIIDLLIKK